MRHFIIYTLSSLILLSGIAWAQKADRTDFVKKAEQNYISSFNHEYTSIVESSIYNVMGLKNYYPEFDYDMVVKALDRLNRKSENTEIRYKSFLATIYFQNGDWFTDLDYKTGMDEKYKEEFFNAIAEKVNSKVLSLSQN